MQALVDYSHINNVSLSSITTLENPHSKYPNRTIFLERMAKALYVTLVKLTAALQANHLNPVKVTMPQQKLAALFGFIAGIAQAAPSPAAAATTGFSSECSDIILNTNWLVANCPNDAGTSVSSGVYLPSHVTNTEGKLKVYHFNCF